jgi:signal transduction histidine kinase
MGDQPAPCIEIGAQPDGAETVLFVRDNGAGIDPRHRSKLFGLFEKLDPSSEGTGIGLALARRIVEVHGGRIWLESEGPGKGCTVRFTLARTEVPAT